MRDERERRPRRTVGAGLSSQRKGMPSAAVRRLQVKPTLSKGHISGFLLDMLTFEMDADFWVELPGSQLAGYMGDTHAWRKPGAREIARQVSSKEAQGLSAGTCQQQEDGEKRKNQPVDTGSDGAWKRSGGLLRWRVWPVTQSCSRVKEDENWPSDLAMWRSSAALRRTVLVK